MGLVAAEKLDQGSGSGKVGADIRALRKSRSMTLVAFAEALDRSVGFVSQIERGISEPSINDLRTIARIFDVSISFFFGENQGNPEEAQYIVRAGSRRSLGNPDGKLLEELLSPDLGGSFEIVRSEFAPGAELTEPLLRETEESGYVISGMFEIEISGKWYNLQPGDSFRFVHEPHRWRNRQSEPAIVIWVISPPVY
ncbi:MAG: XRE family transcriptional regulator [Pseudomonadota bacterium]